MHKTKYNSSGTIGAKETEICFREEEDEKQAAERHERWGRKGMRKGGRRRIGCEGAGRRMGRDDGVILDTGRRTVLRLPGRNGWKNADLKVQTGVFRKKLNTI